MKDQDLIRRRRSPIVDAEPDAAADSRSGPLAAEVQALSRLNEASSRLWHVSDLKTGLQEILAAATALLRSDKGHVQLLGHDGVLRIVAQHGFERAFLEAFREVTQEHPGAAGRALRTGRRVIIEDVDADEQYAPLRDVARAAGYRAVQSTPIMSRDGRRLGMISTHFRAPHRPSGRPASRRIGRPPIRARRHHQRRRQARARGLQCRRTEAHGAHRRIARRGQLRDVRPRVFAALLVHVAELAHLGDGRRASGEHAGDGKTLAARVARRATR